MNIVFLDGKGGAGKTTLSVLFALALHDAGHRPAARDLGPQGTASKWLDLASQKGEFGKHEHPNATIFDTPPRVDSPELLKVARLADKILLISSPSPADIFAPKDTVERIVDNRGRASQDESAFQ